MQITYHPSFKESYSKLPLVVKKKAEKRENIFRINFFDGRLKTHKLHGKLKDMWSFSVDDKYRIVFKLSGRDVLFLDIGDHDVYKS